MYTLPIVCAEPARTPAGITQDSAEICLQLLVPTKGFIPLELHPVPRYVGDLPVDVLSGIVSMLSDPDLEVGGTRRGTVRWQ